MRTGSDLPLAPAQIGQLLLALTPRPPAPEFARRLRGRVLDRVAADRAPMRAIRCADGWQPFGESAQMKVLHDDGRMMSWLVRLPAGARLPAHEHEGAEECLIVAGDLWLNGIRFAAGDYQYAAAGSRHEEVRSDGGCLLLVRSPSLRRVAAAAAAT